ncbi:MAG: hypothetical protein JW908_05775 [Anaerolineales bacterium]|nr:hypothetical protein [Anaerolineales bacterium]
MNSAAFANQPTRLGMQYFQDSEHFREKDATLWIPKFQALGFSWLVLSASTERAIPEYFIQALIEAGIEPILHFNDLTLSSNLPDDIRVLIESYAKWGIKYAILFDRPNCRHFWPAQSWMQSDLVERFLDAFIPIAQVVQESGISPVFPPLEPGGDYWDTAFLRQALQGIARRNINQLSEHLTLSAYVQPGIHPISWGAGGPERWPDAIPYSTPASQQDQRGFHIFSWYHSISQAIFEKSLPIILLESNTQAFTQSSDVSPDNTIKEHSNQCLVIARLLTEDFSSINASLAENSGFNETITEEVLCFNFRAFASKTENPVEACVWFDADGNPLTMIELYQQWRAKTPRQSTKKPMASSDASPVSLAHYVLIPECHENLLAYYLDILRPYLVKHKPVIGFSIDEALLAQKITIVGDIQQYPANALEKILGSGCEVEQIFRDGTDVAPSKTK